jgi:arabinogalactan endo-1,4-beta-galactosidase
VTIVQSAPQVNFLLNGGFDNAGMATALPANWSTWSSGGFEAASYTESSDSTAPFRLSHYRSSSYNVQTYQKLNGLLAGSYTLTARVKSSGGQPTCQMELKVPGQPNHTVGIPVTSTWTQVTIPNISITGGTCQVGFYSWAYGSQWMTVDDVKLTRQ